MNKTMREKNMRAQNKKKMGKCTVRSRISRCIIRRREKRGRNRMKRERGKGKGREREEEKLCGRKTIAWKILARIMKRKRK